MVASNVEILGTMTVRGCCKFTWREPEGGGPRNVDIRPGHCPKCIAEVCRATRPPERRVFESRLEEVRRAREGKKSQLG